MNILPFAVAGRAGGIALEHVRHVVRATAIMKLPRAPRIVEGVIDFHGEIIPVVNLRHRLAAEARVTQLTDRFILANAGDLSVALHVDEVGTVTAVEAKTFGSEAEDSLADGLGLAGAASLPDGMVLIYDVGSFFTSSEREAVQSALSDAV
jgi:purine-binding chemotaxis protein CheW